MKITLHVGVSLCQHLWIYTLGMCTADTLTTLCDQSSSVNKSSQQLFAMLPCAYTGPGHRYMLEAASWDYRTSAHNTQHCHMHSPHDTHKYSSHLKYSKVKLPLQICEY